MKIQLPKEYVNVMITYIDNVGVLHENIIKWKYDAKNNIRKTP